MKIIEVENCEECPYKRDDNGGGFCEPFTMCDKFNIEIDAKYEAEDRWIDLDKEIHPECKLEDQIL